jgi:hypothetical protein
MAARSTSPRQIRPSPRSILARDARHPKAHSPRFLGAHNFLACYLCYLVRIAAFRDHRALSFAAGARTRRPRGNPEVARVVPSLLPPAFPVVPFLALRPRGSTQPPETRRLSGFSDPCAPDPVSDPTEAPRVDRPRSAPALNVNAADVNGQPAKSAVYALKHQSLGVSPGRPTDHGEPLAWAALREYRANCRLQVTAECGPFT